MTCACGRTIFRPGQAHSVCVCRRIYALRDGECVLWFEPKESSCD